MLITQFLLYVIEMNSKFDLFPGCVCCFLDENRSVLTGYGFLGTDVEIAVEAFEAEMASEKPRCYHLAETADTLKGHFVSYLLDGGSLDETDRYLVEETRLVRLLSRICLSDALNIRDDRSGCSSCCYKFHLLIEELHSIFVGYWGRRDDCENSHWSPGSDTKTLVIFLAGFHHVTDKDPSEILCDQLNGQLRIPIVEGDKVVLLKYQSELQRKLNNNCDNESNLEKQTPHEKETFDGGLG